MSDNQESTPGTLPDVWKRFWGRAKKPVWFVNHWVYLLVGVVFLGGLGTLIEYYSLFAYGPAAVPADWLRCAKSLTSYALAVAGTAAVQMVLYEEGVDQLRAPAVALLSLVVFLSIPVLTSGTTNLYLVHALAVAATAIAFLVCWIAAANNEDKAPADAPMGGPMPPVGGSSTLPSQPTDFQT